MKSSTLTLLALSLILVPVLGGSAAQTQGKLSLITKEDLMGYIATKADDRGLDPYHALAIVKVESDFEPEALAWEKKHKTWSVGLFQIFLPTARSMGFRGTVKQLQDPILNTNLGLAHLRTCVDMFGYNLDRLACCHNAGPWAKDQFCRKSVLVRQYVKAVRAAYVELKQDAEPAPLKDFSRGVRNVLLAMFTPLP